MVANLVFEKTHATVRKRRVFGIKNVMKLTNNIYRPQSGQSLIIKE